MKKYLLALLIIPLLIYGCGQTAKQTDSINNSQPQTQEQSIQTLLTSFATGLKNKDTITLGAVFDDTSPIKATLLTSVVNDNVSMPFCEVTLVTANVSGNYINAKAICNNQAFNTNAHFVNILYCDGYDVRITTANNSYKIYSLGTSSAPTSSNRYLNVTAFRNPNNTLSIIIENDNSSNIKTFSLNGIAPTFTSGNYSYYDSFNGNSITLKEDATSLGTYDLSSLTAFSADSAWITNAISKGLNYGVVTLNVGQGYILSSKEITTNAGSWDFQVIQNMNDIKQGSTATYSGWRNVGSGGTFFNYYASNQSLLNLTIDVANLNANQDESTNRSKSSVRVVYARNNKYYAFQTITDNYPNGPVVIGWVELMNTGTRWYINQ